jgi:hypothetical protein
MSERLPSLTLVHAATDGAIAVSCFVIALCLLVFATRNRGVRLSPVFSVFAVLFACGGVMHVCEAGGWLAAGAVFKALTALSCAASAVLTVKCLPAARTMFARVVVIERRVEERIQKLQSDPRYDTPEDRRAAVLLAEIRDLARIARETVTPEEV